MSAPPYPLQDFKALYKMLYIIIILTVLDPAWGTHTVKFAAANATLPPMQKGKHYKNFK